MIHTMVEKKALAAPDKIAIIQGRNRVSYGVLSQAMSRFATFLVNAGLQKGDRVGILSENSPAYIAAYLGTQKAGGVAVDINYQSSAREIKKVVNHCLPAAVVVEQRYAAGVDDVIADCPSIQSVITIGSQQQEGGAGAHTSYDPIRRCSFNQIVSKDEGPLPFPALTPQDLASIIYTSGTTGEPKGVMLSHGNFSSNAESIIDYLRLTDHDSVMVILPFCYSYGKSLLTTHLRVGGTMVLENSFMYPDVVLKKMVDEEVTGFSGVPSTFAIILNRSAVRNYRFPKLRYVTQAGGPMPPQHALELQKVFSDTDIYIMYGQTEAGPRLTYLDPCEVVRKAGSIGKAIPGVTIELITEKGSPAAVGEEGEIVASGENIMAGYWNNPEATKKVLRDGKLYTGDIAKVDEEGFLYVVGRQNDMIKSGAHRISAKEIEEVILEIKEVHEVAVVGVHDAVLGEAIKAFVVLKEDAKTAGKEIQRYCSTRLASFKIPKEVEFVADLPKTNSGKVRRHMLKQTPADMPSASTGKDLAATI